MAKLADILQQERERDTAEQWGIIHLYKTGSFYSAYEWSAWLIAVITFNDAVRMQTKDRRPIAVTRIPMANSDETFCRVGFPLKSGRYVDDSVQIDPDRDWLIQQAPREREFLADELGLQLHMGKLHIREVRQGVEFLGAFVKPYRDYVSNKTLERMTKKIQEIDLRNEDKAVRTIDSYLGILSHTASRCITRDLMSKPLAA